MTNYYFFIDEDDTVLRISNIFFNNLFTGQALIKRFANKKIRFAEADTGYFPVKINFEYITFKQDGFIDGPKTHKVFKYRDKTNFSSEDHKYLETLRKENVWMPTETIFNKIKKLAKDDKNISFESL